MWRKHAGKSKRRLAVIISVLAVAVLITFSFSFPYLYEPAISVIPVSTSVNMFGNFTNGNTLYKVTNSTNESAFINQSGFRQSVFSVVLLTYGFYISGPNAFEAPIYIWIGGELAPDLHPSVIALHLDNFATPGNNSDIAIKLSGTDPSGYVYGHVDSNTSLSALGGFLATGQTNTYVSLHNLIYNDLFASTNKNFYYFGIGLEYDLSIYSGNGFNQTHLFHFIFTLKGLSISVPINLYIQYRNTT